MCERGRDTSLASSSPFLFSFSFPFLLPSDIGRQSLPVRPMVKRKRKRRKEKKRYRPKGATPSRRGSWLGYERPCDSTFILESHACLSSNQPTLPFGRLSFCLLFFVFFFPVFSIPDLRLSEGNRKGKKKTEKRRRQRSRLMA